MGAIAKAPLTDVVRTMLAHDRFVIESAHGMASFSDLQAQLDKLAAERAAARENIDKLAHDETIQIAHKHFDALKGMTDKLHGVLASADGVAVALARRAELLELWHELMPADKVYSADVEAKLIAKADRVFGSATALAAVPDFGTGDAPSEPFVRDVYFLRRAAGSRRITIRSSRTCPPGSVQNGQMVNAYREYLGVMPFEFDARLVNAARAHDKEMAELDYFAHESPVAANKTPWDRIRAAGYEHGSGENIAKGMSTGDEAFWGWFDSPGHHQNMASKQHTALGVGNAGILWTQDFGSGDRLMLAPPDERARAHSANKSFCKQVRLICHALHLSLQFHVDVDLDLRERNRYAACANYNPS